MKKFKKIHYKFLRKTLNPAELHFKTTDEIKALTDFFGQERALQALHFGIGIKSKGFNIYAMGPMGIGKRSLIQKVLKSYAHTRKTPPDWCYIYNFHHPDKPIALRLPAGYGSIFQHDMQQFTVELGKNILSVFESDEYRSRMQKISETFNLKRTRVVNKNNSDLNVIKTPKLYKEQHKKENLLQLRLTKTVVKPLNNKLKKKYLRLKLPAIIKYLTTVQNDVIHHVNDLIKQDETTNLFSFSTDNPALIKYKVNVLVDNS